jgi:predicted ATPase
MHRDLPSGTVTFLFTDIEGSTALLTRLGAAGYAEALLEHRRVLRAAFVAHGGFEVGTEGDSFFVAFPTAPGAAEAARSAQAALAGGPIRVRMGLHTGTPLLVGDGYVGEDVHKAARIAACGHGGQVLLTEATRQLVGVAVTSLGMHLLKGFGDPVGVFQLGGGSFPPLRTVSNTNLPRPASPFLGREREVAEVMALVNDGARLVTLTGPGGSGKTRLALEAVTRLAPEFPDGVFWVGLAPVRDSSLVAETVALTLGAKEGLAAHIGDRRLLLVLDNLEQVVEAAPELSALVGACPHLRVVVTSQSLLWVNGEAEYAVLPLADSDAVALFCSRSGAEPDDAVHRLCLALDNLPLAIELAAARARVLSPQQILERLSGRLDLLKGGRDADPRQQTLRATVEWSYELLSDDEKALFVRLAVFRGGCTLEAAEAVAGAGIDLVQSLVDKNLLRHRDDRFSMLETIRTYAAERLQTSGEAEMQGRHAEYFLALAVEAEPHLRVDSPEWLDILERDHDNLRAALERLEASGNAQRVLQLVSAVWRFWYLRGHILEGGRRLDAALTADAGRTTTRAYALIGSAVMATQRGDGVMTRVRAEEAHTIHRESGDFWGVAYSGFMLGHAAVLDRDFAAGRDAFDASCQAFRALGDESYAQLATENLAWMYFELGDRPRALATHEDNLGRARASGNRRIEGGTLSRLASYALEDGLVDKAVGLLTEGARITGSIGLVSDLADNLFLFAWAASLQEQAAVAARLFAAGEAAMQRLGTHRAWAAMDDAATLARIRAQLDDAAFVTFWEQGRNMSVEDAIALALELWDPHRVDDARTQA